MSTFLAVLTAGFSASNFAMYAVTQQPISLAAGVFCGICSIVITIQGCGK